MILELLSLTVDYTGSSEPTLVKMPHCCKSHVAAHICYYFSLNQLKNNQFTILDTNFCTQPVIARRLSWIMGGCHLSLVRRAVQKGLCWYIFLAFYILRPTTVAKCNRLKNAYHLYTLAGDQTQATFNLK